MRMAARTGIPNATLRNNRSGFAASSGETISVNDWQNNTVTIVTSASVIESQAYCHRDKGLQALPLMSKGCVKAPSRTSGTNAVPNIIASAIGTPDAAKQ